VEIIHITSEKGLRGGEKQIVYLINELEKKGVSNRLICPAKSNISALVSVDVIEFPVDHPYKPRNWFQLKKITRAFSNPVVHLHTPDAHTLAFLSPVPKNIPFVLHRRTMFPIKSNYITIKKYKSAQIRKIICISDTIKNYVDLSLGNSGRNITIHDGIDLNRPKPDRIDSARELKAELHIPASSKIVGNASALTFEKGWDTFLEVARSILNKRSDVHFIIAGVGSLELNLRNKVDVMKISDNVHFIGFKENISKILSGFDVLLMPSRIEGLGTVIMEAFFSNTPVVSTRTGGIPELVMNDKTGLLSEVDDVIALKNQVIHLLDNNEKNELLTKNAANHLLHFSLEAMADKTMDVYRSVS